MGGAAWGGGYCYWTNCIHQRHMWTQALCRQTPNASLASLTSLTVLLLACTGVAGHGNAVWGLWGVDVGCTRCAALLDLQAGSALSSSDQTMHAREGRLAHSSLMDANLDIHAFVDATPYAVARDRGTVLSSTLIQIKHTSHHHQLLHDSTMLYCCPRNPQAPASRDPHAENLSSLPCKSRPQPVAHCQG
jgi:hypothetical protein